MDEALSEFQCEVKKAIKNKDFNKLIELCQSSDVNKYKILKKYLHKELRNGDYFIKCLLGILELSSSNFNSAESIFKNILNSICNCYDKNVLVNYDFYQHLSLVKLAEIEFYRGNYDKAKDMILNIINKGNINDKCNDFYLLGRIYYVEQKYSRSFECFEMSYHINKNKAIAIKNMAFVKFKQKEYEDAFKYATEYYNLMNGNVEKNILILILYLSKKLNVFVENFDYMDIADIYTCKQILDYSDERMLKHVSKHFECGEYADCFKEDEDLFSLKDKIKDQLIPENLHPNFHLGNVYSVYYPNIGKYGSNYLRVVALPITNQIITMFPIKKIDEDIDNNLDDEIEELQKYKK